MTGHQMFDQAELAPFKFTDPDDRVSGENYIYALNLSSGAVKVGFSGNVERRINQHLMNAATYGATVTAAWVSIPHIDARSNEAELLGYCREVATAHLSRETFAGVTFDEVVGATELMEFGRLNGPRPDRILDDRPGQLYPLTEVCVITGIPLITLQRACAEGEVSFMGFPFGPRMSRDHINELLARST